eukprot:gnl/Chilomastix_cuspidata/9671.p1 GENE.gnl/Chilomastix_cuspidata/9671~~gnl/Chilomastix_cuspidata/9671.p1  ORF type:complete len:131 (-),score=3.38 gnl/Chilomastix_cuspidata/9671:218-610(-)
MVVVIILGILATFVVPKLVGRTDDAKVVKAKVDIKALETALKLFKLDTGKYPTTDQGLEALVSQPESGEVKNWKEGGYLDKKSVPKDPWGNEYIYLSPGLNGDYDLMSYGADKMPGGENENADVKSWEIE